MNLNPINLARGVRQVHYAWIVVAIATTILLVTSSIRFATAALVPYLSSSASGFGWSYAAISFGLQPPMARPGSHEPLCRVAWGQIRRTAPPVAWSFALHCWHVADRHYDQSVAVLHLLRPVAGHSLRHFYHTAGIRRHTVVQEVSRSGNGGCVVFPGHGCCCVHLRDRRGLRPAGHEVDFLDSRHSGRSADTCC